MDHFDQKLLALLRDNARLSITELSKAVFLSRSAVSERLRRLEEEGIITGYHAHIRPAEREGVKAFFELSFRMICCEEYAGLLRRSQRSGNATASVATPICWLPSKPNICNASKRFVSKLRPIPT